MKEKIQNEVQIDLYKVKLNNEEKIYGKVRRLKTLKEDQIIRNALTKAGINADRFIAEYNIVKKAILDEVADGASVSFGLGRYNLKAIGSFDNEFDQWDPTRNKLTIDITPSNEVRERLKNLKININGYAPVGGCINSIYSTYDSKLVENKIIPYNGLVIKGKKLKICGSSDNLGVKFININSGEVTVVTSLLTNKPSELQIVVPLLASGQYKLIVATQYNGSRNFNSPIEIEYDKILLVN